MLAATLATAQIELVKDIYPGETIEAHLSPGGMVESNGQALFGSSTSSLGPSLGRTDGTEAGTLLVQDVAPGGASG